MSTTFNFGANNEFNNCQIGPGGTMYVTVHNPLSNNNWSELEWLLENKFVENKLSSDEVTILQNAKSLIKKREENGFKRFIKQNKDSLIVSTLSSLVSDGLMFLFFGAQLTSLLHKAGIDVPDIY